MGKMERIRRNAAARSEEQRVREPRIKNKKERRKNPPQVAGEVVEKWMNKDWYSLHPDQKREVQREINRRIKHLTHEVVERNREAGIPLTGEGRIDMNAYTAVPEYRSRVLRDISEVEKRERYFQRKDEEETDNWEDRMFSDIFERLVPIIFTKFASERFIVVRSAKLDDHIHKTDNVFIDRETGEILCTIDEHAVLRGTVTAIAEENEMGRAEREKFRAVLNLNTQGKTELTYNLAKTDENRFTPQMGNTHPPLCMVTIDREYLLKAISTLETSLDSKNEKEEEVFRFFALTIYKFLKRIIEESEINLYNRRTRSPGRMKERIRSAKRLQIAFKDILDQFGVSTEEPHTDPRTRNSGGHPNTAHTG